MADYAPLHQILRGAAMEFSESFLVMRNKKSKVARTYKISMLLLSLCLVAWFGYSFDGVESMPQMYKNMKHLYIAIIFCVVVFFVNRRYCMSENKLHAVMNNSSPEVLAMNGRTKKIDDEYLRELKSLSSTERGLIAVVNAYVALSILDGELIFGAALIGCLVTYITGSGTDALPFAAISLLMYIATFGTLDKMVARSVKPGVS